MKHLSSTEYYQGYKYIIYPTELQRELIDRCIELSRYAYNWGLEQEQNQYILFKNGYVDKNFLSEYDLNNLFVKYCNLSENKWLKTVPSNSLKSAFTDLIYAYKRFFNGLSNHPKYRSKKKSNLSYKPQQCRSYFKGNMHRIEGLTRKNKDPNSMILVSCNTGLDKKDQQRITNLRISKDRFGNYYVSFNIISEMPLNYFKEKDIPKYDKVIGIDLNARIDSRVVLSDGTKFKGPDVSKIRNRIKRLQRKTQKDRNRHKELERTNPDIKPSNRSKKRSLKLSKLYNKIHNINQNFAHTVTKNIIDMNPKAIVMEDLQMNDINSNHYIAIHTAMNSFNDIIYKMQYKCKKYGIPFYKAPKDFKSSQICSNCGNIKNIHGYHTYICPKCGIRIDRDINAAINLEHIIV